MNQSNRKMLALLGLSLSLAATAAQAATSPLTSGQIDNIIINRGVAPQIAAGGQFSLALKSDGTVWSWGFNGNGQLGRGLSTQGNETSPTPMRLTGLAGMKAVSAGEFHALALKSDGTVWAWGCNLSGQVGSAAPLLGAIGTPVQVTGLGGVTAVAAGDDHNLALKSDGTVWTWGAGYYGQLGTGAMSASATPSQVPGLSGVVGVVAGHAFSAALKGDGSVWVWGAGMLGNGTTTQWSSTPVHLVYPAGVIGGAAGSGQRIEFRGDGTVWTWGLNQYGQLGLDSNTTEVFPKMVTAISGVKAVSAGAEHTTVVKSDGTVWAWGWNYYGQLGNGTTGNSWVPVKVTGLTGVTSVAAAYGHTLALKSDGWVWSWGSNNGGQLGVGSTATSQYSVPVRSLLNLQQ